MCRRFYILLILLPLFTICGCTRNEAAKADSERKEMENTLEDSSNTTREPKQEEGSNKMELSEAAPVEKETATEKEHAADSKEEAYERMIERSLLSSGNNFRMKKVMEKAAKGEEVTVAYIGGSITEGAGASTYKNCYAYQSWLSFSEKFGKDNGKNIKLVNAGMGGTPSALGIIRYDRDVTDYGKTVPDIVFIEFAVNDYQEPTNGEAYESMVRKVLNQPNQPAVVLVFSVFKTKWNMQDFYQPLGDFYDLPMISIKDAVVPELETGRITEEEFFSDEYHPKDFGHQIMKDCIGFYFDAVAASIPSDSDAAVTDKTLFGNAYEELKMLDAGIQEKEIILEKGGFSGNDKELVGLYYAPERRSFPDNWKHEKDGEKESFSMTLNCKNLLMAYKVSSRDSFGEAEVYIDGEKIGSYNGHQENGWNNPITVVLLKEEQAAEHRIEIKMAKGNEEKEFTIMAFGYTGR